MKKTVYRKKSEKVKYSVNSVRLIGRVQSIVERFVEKIFKSGVETWRSDG